MNERFAQKRTYEDSFLSTEYKIQMGENLGSLSPIADEGPDAEDTMSPQKWLATYSRSRRSAEADGQ